METILISSLWVYGISIFLAALLVFFDGKEDHYSYTMWEAAIFYILFPIVNTIFVVHEFWNKIKKL